MDLGIIGGGITGLVVANEAIKRGIKTYLFEAENGPGGLARSIKNPNWSWPLEGFFHHFFTSDFLVKELINELGLQDKLFYQKVNTSIYSEGKIYPYDNPLDFIKFPGLGVFDKLRMGSVIFLLRQLPFLKYFENFTSSEFFPKLIGRKGWEKVWERLMEGKFGQFANQVSFSWLWARIKSRSPQLGYLAGGSQQIFDLLTEKVKDRGQLFLKSPVLKLKPKGNRWEIFSRFGSTTVDKVVLAVSLPQALELTKDYLPVSKLREWDSLKTIGALTIVLRMKSGFLPKETYWLNILDKGFPFVVVVEHTNFINCQHYGGERLVYVGGYYHQQDPIFNWGDQKIFKHFLPGLKKINSKFEKSLIGIERFSSLFAQPIITTNYSQKGLSLELIPNSVYWATPNHIFPWDRGINYSIKFAKELTRLV